MRVLQVVKTTNGAEWAALQAAELVRLGIDVHVALPTPEGSAAAVWQDAGVKMHIADLNFPAKEPWRLTSACRAARSVVSEVGPDLIHSHFVSTTMVLRLALGKRHPVPRLFQVPGPLHLEHRIYRTGELSSAGPSDYWIGSSGCILRHYLTAGVPASRLYFSIYGDIIAEYASRRTCVLRRMLGIADDELVVGNINYMYPPKYYLRQRVGLKCHEDVIDALALVIKVRPDVVGVLAGGAWGNADWYEQRLRNRARAAAGDRIKMPGSLSRELVRQGWADFDCAVHVPLSENYGGVAGPLIAGVPTIAGRVGALPEIVVDGVTGTTVNIRRPAELASAILEVLRNLNHFRALAKAGREFATVGFDMRRLGAEIRDIYRHVLDPREPRPEPFKHPGLPGAADMLAPAVCASS